MIKESKCSTVIKTCTGDSPGNSNIETNLDGDLVPICGRRVWISLCERYFNSVSDVVLCVEEARQCELAENHYRHHLLVRVLLCTGGKRLWGELGELWLALCL